MVRALIKRQEELRTVTKTVNLASAKDADVVVRKEADIRKDLGKLAEMLSRFPATLPYLEQAKAGAFDATGYLFDSKKPEAIGEQGKVLAALAEIEEILQNAGDANDSDKSADQ